jgi:hypothetical protein
MQSPDGPEGRDHSRPTVPPNHFGQENEDCPNSGLSPIDPVVLQLD